VHATMQLDATTDKTMSARLLWDALLAGLRRDGRAALATIVETKGSVPRHAGAKMAVLADGRTVGTVGGGSAERKVAEAAVEAMRDGKPRLLRLALEDDDSVCGGRVSVFVDPVTESPLVVMVGAGHVGTAVAGVASAAGFRVLLVDDRRDVARAAIMRTGANGVVGRIGPLLEGLRLSGSQCVIIATRGHAHDEEALRAVVSRDLAYLGMIGSAVKVRHIIGKLRAEGVEGATLDRVRAPVGLDIGAETPGEIAVAIVAELIMSLRGGNSGPLKDVKGWNDSGGAGGKGAKAKLRRQNAKCKVQNERRQQAGAKG
jgi:xanthine dehydrogenase accessory factor